ETQPQLSPSPGLLGPCPGGWNNGGCDGPAPEEPANCEGGPCVPLYCVLGCVAGCCTDLADLRDLEPVRLTSSWA
ncbi:hypothetical protein KI387_000033, partial [Taxus chinensis]